MIQTFYSNGKLLITAEYFVLDGAEALAVPTRYGQQMEVLPSEKKGVSWISKDDNNRIWFSAHFQVTPSGNVQTNHPEKPVAKTLVKILENTNKLNPGFFTPDSSFQIRTYLDFNKNWGLGTSSTLINNIAQWAGVDPYALLRSSFGGSGYDIACAKHDTPILFSNASTPHYIQPITLDWPFKDELFFVFLNKKQNSRDAINNYQTVKRNRKPFLSKINQLTSNIISCNQLSEFNLLLQAHEEMVSNFLEVPTIKAVYFPDYEGGIKSLGAWGGDFILATGKEAPAYFRNKGFSTVLPFSDIIK